MPYLTAQSQCDCALQMHTHTIFFIRLAAKLNVKRM